MNPETQQEKDHKTNNLTSNQQFWKLELGFWRGARDYYENHLSSQAVMIFPDPVGKMEHSAILNSLGKEPRWQEVTFSAKHRIDLSPEVTLLTYQASACRAENGKTYQLQAVSVYHLEDGEWKLAFHQQIPN